MDTFDPASAGHDDAVWDGINEQWRQRRFDRLREHIKEQLDSGSIDHVDDAIEGKPSADDLRKVLGQAFTAVSGKPRGPVTLALYVYARCLEMWERSGKHWRIRRVLDALSSVANNVASQGSPSNKDDAELLKLVVDQAQHMDSAMSVENAIQCSCPVAARQHSSNIAALAERLMKHMPQVGAASNGPRDLLRYDLGVTDVYYRKVHELSRAVTALLDRDPPAKGHFDGVIGSLLEGEQAIRGDVYESELRTHRATAQGLNGLAESPWVRIERAELVYVYPFAFYGEGAEAEQVVERARKGAPEWVLGGNPGVEPAAVHETLLSDRWEHADPPERTYGGVSIRLPPIEVETNSEEVIDGLEAEVRLSHLGNHYLRIRAQLTDATLHHLNQALRRASPGMGVETLTCEGGRWERFVSHDEETPGYVQDMLDGIALRLRVPDGPELRVVGDPTVDYHVAVRIRELIVDGERDPLRHTRHLEGGVAASLLFHSIGDWATSLEEWVRYRAPKVENLMEGSGRTGDLVARTPDTTVLYMPTSPEWLCHEYQEMVEFVAAMPPVLASWERRARDRAADVEAHLASLQVELADRNTTPDEVHRSLEEIRVTESALQHLRAEFQRQLAELHSPRLVFDRPSRAFLDRLYEAAGLLSLEDDLERQLEIIFTQLERLEVLAAGFTAHVERKAEERQRRLHRFLELGLALIGAISLVTLFEWIHSGFDIRGRAWVWLLEGGLLVLAGIALAILILREPNSRRKADE